MLLPPLTSPSKLWLPPLRGAAIETLQWRVVCDLAALACRSVHVDCFLIFPTPMRSSPSAQFGRVRGKESLPRSEAYLLPIAGCADQRHIHALAPARVLLALANRACPAAVLTSVSQLMCSLFASREDMVSQLDREIQYGSEYFWQQGRTNYLR